MRISENLIVQLIETDLPFVTVKDDLTGAEAWIQAEEVMPLLSSLAGGTPDPIRLTAYDGSGVIDIKGDVTYRLVFALGYFWNVLAPHAMTIGRKS